MEIFDRSQNADVDPCLAVGIAAAVNRKKEAETTRGDAGGSEAALWWEYRRTGKLGLRNRIVRFYWPWALARTRAFAWARRLDWDELWGAAATGLIKAIERFDPSCGVPFLAFAGVRVDGALLDAGRESLGRGARRRRRRPPGRWGPTLRPEPVGCSGDESLEDGGLDPALTPEEALPSREPDPAEEAAMNEIVSRILDSMEDGRLREIARRRFMLAESTDEIALALSLGKTRVNELLRHECLPRARRALRQLGFAPQKNRRVG